MAQSMDNVRIHVFPEHVYIFYMHGTQYYAWNKQHYCSIDLALANYNQTFNSVSQVRFKISCFMQSRINGSNITAIREWFSPEMISAGVLTTDQSIAIQHVIALENAPLNTSSESDFSFRFVVNTHTQAFITLLWNWFRNKFKALITIDTQTCFFRQTEETNHNPFANVFIFVRVKMHACHITTMLQHIMIWVLRKVPPCNV